MNKNKIKGFTILELMATVSISILVFGSFYQLFNYAVKKEAHNNAKSANSMRCKNVLDEVEKTLRMTAMTATQGDFNLGLAIFPNIISHLKGGVNIKNGTSELIDIEYLSSYGSTVAKVQQVSGVDVCSLKLNSTSNIFKITGNMRLVVVGAQGVFFVSNVQDVTSDSIVFSRSSVMVKRNNGILVPVIGANNCSEVFDEAEGLTVTTVPRRYRLNVGISSFSLEYTEFPFFLTSKQVFSYGRDLVPMVYLDFLVEVEDGKNSGVFERRWYKGPFTNIIGHEYNIAENHVKNIKAVRMGIVIASQNESGLDNEVASYKLFNLSEATFTPSSDDSRRYDVCQRVIRLRNYDYLEQAQPTD